MFDHVKLARFVDKGGVKIRIFAGEIELAENCGCGYLLGVRRSRDFFRREDLKERNKGGGG